jgi:glycosyltransferase involved in cell wall biosynthesis
MGNEGHADRLRVLAVIASSEVGGAERVLVSLLKGLDRNRFDVWVACHDHGPMVDEYRRVAAGLRTFDLLDVFNPRTVIAVARLMRELRCQIVHTHLWTADVLGGLAAALARVPIRVATVHGGYFQAFEEGRAARARKVALSRTYRCAYRLFDRVIGVSRAVAEDLVRRPGIRVNAGRVTTIHHGLDPAGAAWPGVPVDRKSLEVSPSAPVLVTVANFFPIKGHRWLVEAMPRIVQRYPEAILVLAGEGEGLPAIRRQVERHGLGRHVRFVGSRREALGLIALSDVVVVPSLSEGLGLVVLEALALGKPVVATRVGGIPEIIEDHETGLLVPPKDPVALSEAILAVLSNHGLAVRLGRNGRQVVHGRFAADTMIRQTEQLYLELATAKGVGRKGDE